METCYGLDGQGIEPRWGGEIFCTCPDRPWSPPSLLCSGYRVSFPGVKRPGRRIHHSPSSKAEVKEIQWINVCAFPKKKKKQFLLSWTPVFVVRTWFYLSFYVEVFTEGIFYLLNYFFGSVLYNVGTLAVLWWNPVDIVIGETAFCSKRPWVFRSTVQMFLKMEVLSSAKKVPTFWCSWWWFKNWITNLTRKFEETGSVLHNLSCVLASGRTVK